MVIQYIAITVLSACVALLCWFLWLMAPLIAAVRKERAATKPVKPKPKDKPAPKNEQGPFLLGREHRVAVLKRKRARERWGPETVIHYQRRL